mmetsp:Transcript_26325/g.61406  ORF Transcript_26325/g.61406 Transcript_26325/m.61406 type:complete len:241 (-) Transcript_26325:395-1117(-)
MPDAPSTQALAVIRPKELRKACNMELHSLRVENATKDVGLPIELLFSCGHLHRTLQHTRKQPCNKGCWGLQVAVELRKQQVVSVLQRAQDSGPSPATDCFLELFALLWAQNLGAVWPHVWVAKHSQHPSVKGRNHDHLAGQPAREDRRYVSEPGVPHVHLVHVERDVDRPFERLLKAWPCGGAAERRQAIDSLFGPIHEMAEQAVWRFVRYAEVQVVKLPHIGEKLQGLGRIQREIIEGS